MTFPSRTDSAWSCPICGQLTPNSAYHACLISGAPEAIKGDSAVLERIAVALETIAKLLKSLAPDLRAEIVEALQAEPDEAFSLSSSKPFSLDFAEEQTE